MSDVEIVLRAHALNGETPVWCGTTQRLFWIDLREPALHEFDPKTRSDRSWEMPAWIGCYGLTGSGALTALRNGLFHLRFDTGALDFVAPPPFDPRRFLFNDGRADPRGRFLAGTMYLPLAPGDGQKQSPHGTPLWRHDGQQRWTPLTPDAQTSNGTAFSPDGTRFYHSDTEQKTVFVWDYDAASGGLANRRVFARLDDVPGKAGPDGANVDRDGFYWCAVFGHGALRRYDPAGRLEREIRLPARYATMPAFGGADRQTIFVTSATWPIPGPERAQHPDEGSLMALAAPAPGLAEPLVEGQ